MQLKTDGNSFLNVTGAGKNNFTTWSTISNETTPGANQIEAQLKCIKPDGSYLIKHNVHNFTVSAPQNESAPVPKNNSGAPIHANLTNQLVPSNFKNPTGNFSRPIQNDLTNITGVPPPIHKDNVTTASVQKNTTIPTPPVNKTKVPETVSTAKPDGLPIVNMPHVTGHHKTIHIHFSH